MTSARESDDKIVRVFTYSKIIWLTALCANNITRLSVDIASTLFIKLASRAGT